MRRTPNVLRTVFLCLFFSLPLRAAGEEAVVADVIDGERIVVRHHGRESIVKLVGVAIPERARALAVDALKIEFVGRSVHVEHDVPALMLDGSGNRLAYVYRLPEGTSLNHFLIRHGLAAVPSEGEFALRRELIAAQSSARLENRGIWSGASPALSWETRYRHLRYLGEVNYQSSAPRQQEPLAAPKPKQPPARVKISNRK